MNPSLRCFSVSATIPAAVVNAPLGSANTDTSNGGTMCFLASCIISIASCVSLPPKNIPVLFKPDGDLENIASCTRDCISDCSTPVYGMILVQPASCAIFTSNGLAFFSDVIRCKICGFSMNISYV